MHKNVITLSMLALMFGCQPKTEKVVYELPKSAHLVELEHQERALKDSLEKYMALGDTIQFEHYHALYKATTDSTLFDAASWKKRLRALSGRKAR